LDIAKKREDVTKFDVAILPYPLVISMISKKL